MRPPQETSSQTPPSAPAEVPSTVNTSPPGAVPPTRDPSTPAAGAGAAPLPAPAGRYQLGEEIGRGGMGAVLRARDPHLNRDLAVKVLRGDGHTSPDLVRRFLEEAQVCGQLQHPGVVPVHDLGTLPDGQPFIAMKLVKGRTLAELLRERSSPADGLPHLLGVFEQVCQAVGYAHSKGVIHRDLKPANVMVGAFNEVQVMDWGLAKVLRPQGGPAAAAETAASVVRTVRSAAGEGSRDGQAMGTPAYMAPEQARGEVDLLDERCDVFGLGAILCELLTGAPPFPGRSPEAHARAMCADLADAFARLDGCGAGAELVRLAKACLAAEPGPRPRDAGAVAAAVTAYRESVQERLRRAELERARAQVQAAEDRKRRRLTLALAASVLVTALAGGAGAWWWDRLRTEKRQAIEADLTQVRQLQAQARWGEAGAVLDQVKRRLGDGGPADLRGWYQQARDELGLVSSLDRVRLKRATWVVDRFDKAGADGEYEQAFRDSGMAGVGGDVSAAAAWVRGKGVREALVAALDDWALCAQGAERRAWVLAVVRLADPGPWRDAVRDPANWEDQTALARLAADPSVPQQSPQLVAVVGERLARMGEDAESFLRSAQERCPNDFWINFHLGNLFSDKRKPAEAVGYYRVALAARPGTPAVHNNLGLALREQGRRDEAVGHFEQALRTDPKHPPAHTNLGLALHAKGKLDEAIRHYEEALRLAPKNAGIHSNLGLALKDRGRLEEAVSHLEQALRLDPLSAKTHNNLGVALLVKGKLDEAVGHFEEAARLDPKEAGIQFGLGRALEAKGKLDEAVGHFEEAARLDPKNAKAFGVLGAALGKLGRYAEARDALRRCLDLLPRLDFRRALVALQLQMCEGVLVSDHLTRGVALYDKGKLEEAAGHFEQALRIDPKNATAHFNLGNALRKDKLDEAIRCYEEALRLDPKLAQAHVNYGNTLRAKGKVDEAVGHYREALRLDPKDAKAHGGLGGVLLAQGRWAEAQDATRRCLELLPPNDPLRAMGTRQLQRCERMLALEARIPAVLAGKDGPAGAAERLDFAALCRATMRHTTAARLYAEASAADPKLAEDLGAAHRYNAACCAALAAAGRGADAPKDDKERSRLRRQALGSLRADLALRAKQAESAKAGDRAAAAWALRYWQQDADLTGVRDKQALAALPAEERAEWEKLWAEVADLLRRTDAAQAGK
jgi:serine/threonine-protein kinase